MPDGALGEAVLAALERFIPLITVANPSLLNVEPHALGLSGESVLHAGSYAEAAGLVMALREVSVAVVDASDRSPCSNWIDGTWICCRSISARKLSLWNWTELRLLLWSSASG